MEPVWLEHYPDDVPRRMEFDPARSLVDWIEDALERWPDRPAFTNMGCTLSFREIDALSLRFAAYLQSDLGLQPGDRVALMLPNLLQYPVALLGCLRAGMVVVNVNPLYTPRELKHQLTDSGAVAIVIYAGSAHALSPIIADTDVRHTLITNVGDLLPVPKRQIVNFVVRYVRRMIRPYDLPQAIPYRSFLQADPVGYRRPEGLSADDLAILQYTGGTTGLSKGAMLSHGNLIANAAQVNAWFGDYSKGGEEVIITALPLYHVYALTVNCLTFFEKGSLNVLITDPRDTAGLIKEMSRWPFSVITGVNTLFQSLVRHPDFKELDFSTLKVVSAGGMAMQEATAREFAEITGKQVIEGYGLTETSPVLTSNPTNLKEFGGFIGLPLPNTEISIRDDDGNEVPIGEAGELYARGPQVMLGYWNNPEATAATIGEDGFLKTGDMAVADERGYFRIVDRKKDMIIVSGFNVYPNEIENVVTGHPDVLEAAVIGIDGDDSGEAVKLFTVMREGSTLSEKELRSWCKQNMTAYKVPTYVEFVDDLPKSNVGKVLRRELREREAAQRAAS
ncbi:MAG: AMP-binding protein [Gammaproteobacteria bacterium]|nr:AMP-binding protein [Gammaproteobacteria bacterium]